VRQKSPKNNNGGLFTYRLSGKETEDAASWQKKKKAVQGRGGGIGRKERFAKLLTPSPASRQTSVGQNSASGGSEKKKLTGRSV